MEIKRIFLVGFMGSGKSTLAKRLTSDLGWEYIDLDDYFETHYLTTIANYFSVFGEEAFRRAERKMLHKVINKDRVIIATGGGTPCFYDNMEIMNANGLCIYIKLSLDTLVGRLSGPRQVRPLVKGKSGEELKQYISEKLAEREMYYNKARVVVDAEVIGADGFKRIIEASGTLMK